MPGQPRKRVRSDARETERKPHHWIESENQEHWLHETDDDEWPGEGTVSPRNDGVHVPDRRGQLIDQGKQRRGKKQADSQGSTDNQEQEQLEEQKEDDNEWQDVDTNTDLVSPYTSPPGPHLTTATQAFAARLISSAAIKNVPLSDLQDSDIESDASVSTVEEYAPPQREPPPDNATPVPSALVQSDVSDFHMALGLWCDKEGIKRRSYESLFEVLSLLECSEVQGLPRQLATLQRRCRSRLPLPSIQKAIVPVRKEKQPSGIPDPSRGNLYYFDTRALVSTLLSASSGQTLHTGMAEIVDCPSEYWQSHCWGSSIRTCSGDFLTYPDQSPIVPSDFVQYRCLQAACDAVHGTHCAQVTFFGRDRRTQSGTLGLPLLKIRPVVNSRQSADYSSYLETSVQWQNNELVLLEDAESFIQPHQILARRFDISITRDEGLSSQTPIVVRRVFNVTRRVIRPISLMSPIRAELELEAFSREFIIQQLMEGVLSLPLILFIDDFGLYRNMYRSLTGIYIVPAGLSISERQKAVNAHTVTLGPHGSNFNDVIKCLHTSMGSLDRGCILQVNGQNQRVWAPILVYLGDMKQQQSSAGFLGPRAHHCCRFCDAGLDNRGDLQRDTVLHGRYHYQVQRLRLDSSRISGKAKRVAFLARHGLAPEPSALEDLTPALDLVLSRPPDPAHSEYFGLVRRLYPLLYSKILTKRAAEAFTAVFQQFPFPPGWGRIQSPATHMGSWTMAECARASVVVPIMLRCWLRESHIREPFKTKVAADTNLSNPLKSSSVDIIVSCFGKLARANSLISAFTLSLKDRQEFHIHIIDARQCFIGMMNAGVDSSGTRSQHSQSQTSHPASRQGSMSVASVTTGNYLDNDESLPDPDFELGAQGTASKLPNFHIGLHFERMMEEYGVVWNANVFFGEEKHKFFKQAVLSTNHCKPERQLLVKDAVRSTIKALMGGAFQHTDPVITTQIAHLRENCPNLLNSLLSPTDRADFDNEDSESMALGLLASLSHKKPAVHGKFKRRYTQQHNLSTKIFSTSASFQRLMQVAMLEYGLHGIHWGSKSLYWYEEFSYTAALSSKRYTFHIGDYLLLSSGEYAQLHGVYTHCLQYEETRRVFLWTRLLKTVSYMDEVLNLSIYRLTRTERVVTLSAISPHRVYMVPLDRALNETFHPNSILTDDFGAGEKGDMDLLHCTWDVNFS